MKKLLVCLLLCVIASFTVLKIQGIPVPDKYVILSPDYEGSDVFIITIGEEPDSTFIVMKDGKIINFEVLTEEQIQEFIKKESTKRGI